MSHTRCWVYFMVCIQNSCYRTLQNKNCIKQEKKKENKEKNKQVTINQENMEKDKKDGNIKTVTSVRQTKTLTPLLESNLWSPELWSGALTTELRGDARARSY